MQFMEWQTSDQPTVAKASLAGSGNQITEVLTGLKVFLPWPLLSAMQNLVATTAFFLVHSINFF